MGRKTLKEFYCAFCRTPRKIKTQKHIGFYEVGLSLLGSLCLMMLFYNTFDFRFFPVFCIFMVVCEILIQMGQRLSMACPHCGFDPIVYKVSPEKAALVVKDYLLKRKKDPLVLFTRVPTPNLPTRPKAIEYDESRKLPKPRKPRAIAKKPAHIAKNLDIQL